MEVLEGHVRTFAFTRREMRSCRRNLGPKSDKFELPFPH